MGKDKVAKDHISSMHDCVPQDFKIKEMKKSQAWTTTGFYDFAKRTGDLEKGKQSEVMAISIVLVAGPPGMFGSLYTNDKDANDWIDVKPV